MTKIVEYTIRKKPVEVKAVKFDGDDKTGDAIVDWIHDNDTDNHSELLQTMAGDFVIEIHTLEGKMLASSGDWVIRGVNGEFYPIKDAILQKTYDIIDSEIV